MVDWATLIPVIVGGAIGVLGAILGPPLSHLLTERAERKKQREQLLQELICILYDHVDWMKKIRFIRVWGDKENEPPSPLPKARALSVVHFPDLDEDLTYLERKAGEFEIWTLKAGVRRTNGEIAKVSEGSLEAYSPYLDAHLALIEKLKSMAKEAHR